MLLPLTPAPKADESPKGYLTRLAEANGYSGTSLLVELMCSSPEYVITPGWQYDRLRSILGEKCSLPEGFGYRLTGKATREGGKLLGHALHVRHLGLSRARLCLHCLEQSGYVPAKWDLKAYLACPIHGRMLLKFCGACGIRVTYARPGVFVCGCGADLRSTTTALAPPALVGICELLDAIATGDRSSIVQAQVLGMPVRELLGMDLEVFLRTVIGIACVTIGLRGRTWPVKQTQVSEALPDVGEVLSNWPINFQRLCARWQAHQFRGKRKPGSFQACFNWLFVGLHKNLKEKRGQTTFLLHAALRYGVRHWEHGPVMVREKELKELELPPPKYGTFKDAAKVLRWPAHTVVRWLAAGRLPAVKLGAKKNRPRWCVDLESLAAFKASRFPSVGQREAAKYLGVPHAVYRELQKGNAIPGTHATEFRNCASREDLDLFVAGIVIRVTCQPTRDPTITLSEFFNSTYSIKGKAETLRAIANGEVPVYGPGASSIRDLSIPRERVAQHVGKQGLPPGLLSVHAAAKQFNLGFYEARSIVRLLGGCKRGRRGINTVATAGVQEFLQNHVPLRRVADEVSVWPVALAKAVKERMPGDLVRLAAGCGPRNQGGAVFGLFLKVNAVTRVRRLAAQLKLRARVAL